MPTLEQNLEGIFEHAGWFFPAGAGGRPEKYLVKIEDSLPAIRRLPRERRRTVVQAGAAVGGWPITLAKHFQRVITAEPDPANWICLNRNLDAQPQKIQDRITAHNAAFGNEAGIGAQLYNPKNSFGHKFRFSGEHIPDEACKYMPVDGCRVMAIDDFGLDDLDALFLDIEGSESLALKGAEKTIRECQPIILTEIREHGALHGDRPDTIERWLKPFGYARLRRAVGKDIEFVPKWLR